MREPHRLALRRSLSHGRTLANAVTLLLLAGACSDKERGACPKPCDAACLEQCPAPCDATCLEQCPQVPPIGACCGLRLVQMTDPSLPISCLDGQREAACTALGGSWFAGATCALSSEPSCAPLGSCCVPGGAIGEPSSCLDLGTSASCAQQPGATFRAGTTCAALSTEDCPTTVVGACCVRSGPDDPASGPAARCLDDVTAAECSAIGGTYQANSACGALVDCPTTLTGHGACCTMMLAVPGNDLFGSCQSDVAAGDCPGQLFDGRSCAELDRRQCPGAAVSGEGRSACLVSSLFVRDGATTAISPATCIPELWRDECESLGGTFLYPSFPVDCSAAPATGACCTMPTCTDRTDGAECFDTFFVGYSCFQVDCGTGGLATDLGACCLTGELGSAFSCVSAIDAQSCATIFGGFFVAGATTCGACP